MDHGAQTSKSQFSLANQQDSSSEKFIESMIHSIIRMSLILTTISGLHAAQPGRSSAKPNIVVILVDDMGYGDLGCYNPQSKIATPHIDRLAVEGMRFTDAHAPGPLCHPSRYGLMTGRYPFRTDITRWHNQALIDKDQTTLPSLLKSEGYHTAMVGKWHLGFLENGYDKPLPGGPADCGFDRFFGFRASTDIPPYFYIRGSRAVTPPTAHIAENHTEGWLPTQGEFWRAGGIAPDLKLDEVLPKLTDEACAVIESQAVRSTDARKPFMLYFALTAPHTPWLPATEFVGKSGAGMYGDFVMMVDAQIGRVVAALDKADLSKDTLLIFTSDNGPVWRPDDIKRFGHDPSGGLRGMKGDVWEAGHRMPFIVRWPGQVKAGSVSDQTICFTDLIATAADICGTDLPSGAGPDSFSFLPVLHGTQPTDQAVRGPIVMQAGSSSTMLIRSGDWKLINQLGSGGFSDPKSITPGPGDPTGQLYNLRTDLAETNNLFLKHPEIVTRLEGEMKQIVKATASRDSKTE
jgi:arylsulfatase A